MFDLFVNQFETRADSILEELQIVSQNEDAEQVIQEAHRLRGIAGNLGAKQVQQLTATIEQAARQGDIVSVVKSIELLPQAVGRVHRELRAAASSSNP